MGDDRPFEDSPAWRRSSEAAERDLLGRLRTASALRQIMPKASDRNVRTYAGPLYEAMRDAGIDSAEQQAMFLANVAVESGNLGTATGSLAEDGYYRDPARLKRIYSSKFKSVDPAPYTHNPQGLFNFVYQKEDGNGPEASGDGWRYRGRGLLQITHRDTYADVERAMNERYAHDILNGRTRAPYQLVANPDQVASDADAAARSAAAYWTLHGGNSSASMGGMPGFEKATRTINGKAPAMAERRAAYLRARQAYGLDPSSSPRVQW